jgi:hypothetical protein
LHTRSLNRLRVGLLVAAMTGSGMLAAETDHYRWLNERGQPVYSDRPPPKGVNYEVISSSSNLKRVVSADEGAVPLETKSSVGNQFDSVSNSKERPSTKNTELCTRATMNLIALESEGTINVRNDQGEVKALSPQEREIARQTAKAQKGIYCE